MDAYDRFERWDAQQERSAAEWYADLWAWMREQSDLTPPDHDLDGYEVVRSIARRQVAA